MSHHICCHRVGWGIVVCFLAMASPSAGAEPEKNSAHVDSFSKEGDPNVGKMDNHYCTPKQMVLF